VDTSPDTSPDSGDGQGDEAGAQGAGRRLRRRERGTAQQRKDHRYTIAVDDLEDVVVRAAAQAAGMTPGAWASRTVVAVARGEVTPLPATAREALLALFEARIQVARIGTNLNQIATAVNTAAAAGRHPAGAVTAAQLDAVTTRVMEALIRIDDASVDVSTTLRTLTRAPASAGSRPRKPPAP
jgi:hypothetical protein